MKMVKLKNGGEEPEGLVKKVTVMLHLLNHKHWSALFELDHKARNPDSKLFPMTVKNLQDVKLLEKDGAMNASIRNIVLSAVQVTEDRMDFKLQDPVVQDPANPGYPLRPGPRIMI